MKNNIDHYTSILKEIFHLRWRLLFVLTLVADLACSPRHLTVSIDAVEITGHRDDFLSSLYNHFESGVLFADIEFGLDVLWRASFKNGNAYKENLAFFVPGGLLISPNRENTNYSARLSALPKQLKGGKLFVSYNDTHLEVLGIIHTHPDFNSEPKPAPQYDYQYCYLGIHNYIMDHHNLFEAYKDSRGREAYKRLGPRTSYSKIPFINLERNAIASEKSPDQTRISSRGF